MADKHGPNGALIKPLLGSFHTTRPHRRCSFQGCKRCISCNSLQCGSKVEGGIYDYRCVKHPKKKA